MCDNETDNDMMGGQRPSDAYDFGRRRVAAVLRREKPWHEQESAERDLDGHLERMLKLTEAFDMILIGDTRIMGWNICKGRSCIVHFPCTTKVPLGRRFRRSAANFYSRFLRLAFPR
jgi:hypothetical protein